MMKRMNGGVRKQWVEPEDLAKRRGDGWVTDPKNLEPEPIEETKEPNPEEHDETYYYEVDKAAYTYEGEDVTAEVIDKMSPKELSGLCKTLNIKVPHFASDRKKAVLSRLGF